MKEFDYIETKFKKLIDIAKRKMRVSKDCEHDMSHIEDVVFYTKRLMSVLNKSFDAEVCILSAYWHDVGRLKGSSGHERRSAEMLKDELLRLNFEESFIEKCFLAISDHKYNMTPKTIEGQIIKDADKLAWLGQKRWIRCLENNQNLDSIVELLPKLRNDILVFDESRKIYDEEIVKLLTILYNKLRSN